MGRSSLSASPLALALFLVVAPLAGASVVYVDWGATGANDGTLWGDAYVSLQSALLNAAPGDSIWVAAGTYYPSASGNRESSFQLADDVAVLGGFAGHETSPSERDWAAHATVLSGDIGVPGDDSDNCHHVVTASWTGTTAVLDGFTITGGNAEHPDFEDPRAQGGGVYNEGGAPTLANLTISGNAAFSYGGGMCNVSGAPSLTSVTFSGNTAGYGGGCYNYDSSPTLVNVVFVGNSASGPGGGMCGFAGSNPTLTNVTFTCNTAGYGGGMLNNHSNPTLVNTILWGDSASYVGNEMYNDLCAPVASYCLIQGGMPSNCLDGGHNVHSDPLFVDGPGGDVRLLSPESSAFDAGDNLAPGLPATDRDGNARVRNGTVDIGAYELQIDDVAVPAAPEPLCIVSMTPNPFFAAATMRLALAAPEHVIVKVYDPAGRLVRTLADEPLPAGEHEFAWDGRDGSGRRVAGGVYFLSAQVGKQTAAGKLVLLK